VVTPPPLVTVDESGDRWSASGVYLGNIHRGRGRSDLSRKWDEFAAWAQEQRAAAADTVLSWTHLRGCVEFRAAVQRGYELQALWEFNRRQLWRGNFPLWDPAEWAPLAYGLKPDERRDYSIAQTQKKAEGSGFRQNIDALYSSRAVVARGDQGTIDFGDGDDEIEKALDAF